MEVYVKPQFTDEDTDADKWVLGFCFGVSTVVCLLSVMLCTLLWLDFNRVRERSARIYVHHMESLLGFPTTFLVLGVILDLLGFMALADVRYPDSFVLPFCVIEACCILVTLCIIGFVLRSTKSDISMLMFGELAEKVEGNNPPSLNP